MARRLLFSVTAKDCNWDYFTCGGKGGSGKDTSNNGVRCTHQASGARAEARDSRDQLRNKRQAFVRMLNTPEFKKWHRIEVAKRTGEYERMLRRVEEAVDEQMHEKYIKVQTYVPDDSDCICHKDSNGTRKCNAH